LRADLSGLPHINVLLGYRERDRILDPVFMGKTYGDALCSKVGKRYSVSCGEANTSGAAHFYHFEGFLAGRELMEPFSVQYSP
jgi:hypothetical protein